MSEAGHDGSEHVLPPLRSVGKPVDEVDVVLNTRFFELFSRNLYRSPNKAFEELVSNSWDAGAASVYIGIPQGLKKLDATVWILDNGESMDAAGLKQLWRIADSRKARLGKRHGREPIGKFGIGKLATYLLAARLTYVCKAADGKIRLVEMDYSEIEKRTDAPDGTAGGDLLLGGKSGVKLPLNELSEAEFEELLQLLPDGMRIRTLIKAGVPKPTLVGAPDDEFRHPDETTEEVHNTWTLAVMTDLKTLGRGMQLGWIRYMLRAALPLGRTMAISLNDETLTSTKLALPVEKELALDKGLGFWEFEHRDPEDPTTKKTFTITPHSTPYPHVTIDGFEGRITGTIKRYVSSISGKKSDELERSNGYFINVLGRVVNAEDPYFGLENLNHSVWSQFRMCVRADGLNPLIGINREQLNDDERLRV
ncbi:MAG: hypothetical protein QOJ39_2270, partial [Candidatus Eremiobacteraeota bacterium]|nr:hypothetical protein [Candidatus Eremiobacteraeota bacterium]